MILQQRSDIYQTSKTPKTEYERLRCRPKKNNLGLVFDLTASSIKYLIFIWTCLQVHVGETDYRAQIMAQLEVSLLSNITRRLAAARAIYLRAHAAIFEELEASYSHHNPALGEKRLVVQCV